MKADEFDKKFDEGEDITSYLELTQARRPGHEQKRGKIDINAVRSICNEIRNLPILDSRTLDEIIGYNEFGISK